MIVDMRRLVAFVVLLAVIYVSVGTGVYLEYIAHWCNVDFKLGGELLARMLFWPSFLRGGGTYCD